MKSLAAIMFGSAVLFCTSCEKISEKVTDKVKEYTEFNEDIHYVEVMGIPDLPYVPGLDSIPGGGLHASFPAIPLETNSKTIMEEYNTSPELISDVSVKAIGADFVYPLNGNFDALDTVELYLSARDLPEILVAFQRGIPQGSKRLDMECVDLNIKEYFLEDTMWIRFAGHFVKFPDTATQISVDAVFNIIGNPLN